MHDQRPWNEEQEHVDYLERSLEDAYFEPPYEPDDDYEDLNDRVDDGDDVYHGHADNACCPADCPYPTINACCACPGECLR